MTEAREREEYLEEIQSLREQLLQAQKMSTVGALASSITHEFNNILTTVINYAKMGLRHKTNETREKAFNKILMAGQRASKITTGMLSYARNGEDRREVMDLTELVQDVLVLVEKDLQIHRVRLETHVEGRAIAEVHASQIQQVLLNMIINARQAMDGGGRLDIGIRGNTESCCAEISIRDSGHGIPGDQLRKIFDQFYTTKTADEGGQGGTGLGLALARDVIESHNGRLRVDSAVGKGTTFTLKFPLAQEPQANPALNVRGNSTTASKS